MVARVEAITVCVMRAVEVVGAARTDQRFVGVGLVGVVGIPSLALVNDRLASLVALGLFQGSGLGREEDMVSPAPADELAQLLEDEQV